MNDDSMMPSFSMVHSLENRFNLVVYSCTTNKRMDNDMIHNDNALRLILQQGMWLIFHQTLINSGGRYRLGTGNETLINLRLLCCLWTELNNGLSIRGVK